MPTSGGVYRINSPIVNFKPKLAASTARRSRARAGGRILPKRRRRRSVFLHKCVCVQIAAMGWHSETTVLMGSPESAAELFQVANRLADGESFGTNLPHNMDNSATVREDARPCRHFETSRTCPYGRDCHFMHHEEYNARDEAEDTAVGLLKLVASASASRTDDNECSGGVLWDVVIDRLQGCPSRWSRDNEGTSWTHVPNPAAYAAGLQESVPAGGEDCPVDIVKRLERLLAEAGGVRSMQLDVAGLKRLLRGPNASTEALDEKLRAAVETVERRLHELHNPQCTCGAEERARRDRRDIHRAYREEEGGDDGEEHLSDEYHSDEYHSDGDWSEPEHSGSCPCWEPNYRRDGNDQCGLLYYGEHFNYIDRGVRQRGAGYDEHSSRLAHMRELQDALGCLAEARQLNQVTGTPSKMSLEELQAEAAACLERRQQGLGRELPPLDVSDCATRWDYTVALSRARHFELSPYEWMRVAFSVAAEEGLHIVIRKQEG